MVTATVDTGQGYGWYVRRALAVVCCALVFWVEIVRVKILFSGSCVSSIVHGHVHAADFGSGEGFATQNVTAVYLALATS